MNCTYCRSWNQEDEHRCTRCGRILRNAPAAKTAYSLNLTSGSMAATARAIEPQAPAKSTADNVIPFDTIAQRALISHAVPPPPGPAPVLAPRVPAQRRSPARPQSRHDRQAALDFLVAPPPGPRTLKTSVEALIICDAPVASPRHRAVAATLDAAVIVAGFSIFLLTFHLLGGMFLMSWRTLPWFGAAFLSVVLAYGLLWALAGRETAGMLWSGLRLVDFDGYAPDRVARLLRLAGTCVSLCAFGTGLAWALFDEEQLAWNDHMSKTFPTFQESNSNFLRKR